MKYLIITGNPKQDGMCYGVTQELIRGVKDGGIEPSLLKTTGFDRCQVCGDGWGLCREERRCAFGNKDGFDEAQELVRSADQFCFITPVYWQEMAEGLKCFFDRLRRCEFGQKGALSGKQALIVASAGGTGNGLTACIDQMERFCRHTGAVIFDAIGINRWNNDYQKQAVYAAARSMAEGRKAGETLK